MLLPQLQTGACVQLDVRSTFSPARSINRLLDGSVIAGPLTTPMTRRWHLSYRGLTPEEFTELNNFCRSTTATAEGFVFLNPFSNLLDHSEDLTSTSWQHDPLLTVSMAPIDTSGHRPHTLNNAGMVEQAIRQQLPISGAGLFCLSCTVRSAAPTIARLEIDSTVGSLSAEIAPGTDWKEAHLTGLIAIPTSPMTVSLAVAPGSAIEVGALQLEHQPYPSPYKPTTGRGGVHDNARVIYESFVVFQQSPNWYDCSFQIEI